MKNISDNKSHILTPIDMDILTEYLCDAEPLINFHLHKKSDENFKKEIQLAEWHHHYKLYKYTAEVNKLTSILGNPTYRGANPFEDIEFFEEECIWGYQHEKSHGYVFLYLGNNGTSIEVTEECEPYITEILDEIITTIMER